MGRTHDDHPPSVTATRREAAHTTCRVSDTYVSSVVSRVRDWLGGWKQE